VKQEAYDGGNSLEDAEYIRLNQKSAKYRFFQANKPIAAICRGLLSIIGGS